MSQPERDAPPRWMSTRYLREMAREAEARLYWLKAYVDEEEDAAEQALAYCERAEERWHLWLRHRERELLGDLQRQQIRLLP